MVLYLTHVALTSLLQSEQCKHLSDSLPATLRLQIAAPLLPSNLRNASIPSHPLKACKSSVAAHTLSIEIKKETSAVSSYTRWSRG